MIEREPDSLAAREAIDAITSAQVAGKVSQDAVTWVYSKAFAQFREEALRWATQERRREQ